jgi:hypothetical protein
MADMQPTSQGDAGDASKFAIPGGGVAAGLVCGIVGGAVLGVIYAHLGAWLPVYYLPAPIFMGWGIGAACGLGSRLGGRLAPRVAQVMGAASGLVTMYVSWVFYVLAQSSYKALAISPMALREVIGKMAADGVWTVRGWTPKNGELLFIWGVEFVLVVLVAAGTAAMYCEERDTEDSRMFRAK